MSAPVGRGGLPLPKDTRDIHGLIRLVCILVLVGGGLTIVFTLGFLTGRATG